MCPRKHSEASQARGGDAEQGVCVTGGSYGHLTLWGDAEQIARVIKTFMEHCIQQGGAEQRRVSQEASRVLSAS